MMNATENKMNMFMVMIASKRKSKQVEATKDEVLALLALLEDYLEPETRKQKDIYKFFNQKSDYRTAIETLERGEVYTGFDLDGEYAVAISSKSFDEAKLEALKEHNAQVDTRI
jgi:hypothetical protein